MTPRELENLGHSVKVLTRDYVYRCIGEFAAYEEGWLNGEGVKFDTNLLSKYSWDMTSVINQFGLVPPAITPTLEGGVQAEWWINDNLLTIEFKPDGTAEMFGTVLGSVEGYESVNHMFNPLFYEHGDVVSALVRAMNEFRDRCE